MRATHLTIALAALLTLAACGEGAAPVGQPVPPVDSTSPPTSSPTPPSTPPSTSPPTSPPTSTGPDTAPRYDADRARAELDAAKQRWAEAGWASYRFAYTPTCFCPRDEIAVEVIGGRLVDPGPDGIGDIHSVEQWFDEIEAAIGTAADVRVTYADTGVPTSVYIDVDEMTADEEFGYELVDIEQVTDPLATFLDEEFGCGYGFAVADARQTVAMVVSFDELDDWEKGPDTGTYDLADLNGTVRVGTDLMANWCDDVMEEGEPEPITDETWDLTGGTLELSKGDGQSALGTFTDVVAVDADGERFELGDITVTNQWWGTFAG